MSTTKKFKVVNKGLFFDDKLLTTQFNFCCFLYSFFGITNFYDTTKKYF